MMIDAMKIKKIFCGEASCKRWTLGFHGKRREERGDNREKLSF